MMKLFLYESRTYRKILHPIEKRIASGIRVQQEFVLLVIDHLSRCLLNYTRTIFNAFYDRLFFQGSINIPTLDNEIFQFRSRSDVRSV